MKGRLAKKRVPWKRVGAAASQSKVAAQRLMRSSTGLRSRRDRAAARPPRRTVEKDGTPGSEME